MAQFPNLLGLDFKTDEGAAFDVPVQGSLGLLALGDIGLMVWRQAREKARQEKLEEIQRKRAEREKL